jgi:hypothetical protein
MAPIEVYVDLKGRSYSLAEFDGEESLLVRELMEYASTHDWDDYSNFWMPKVGELYAKRGLTRGETVRTAVYRIAQDLGSRLAVATGLARLPDRRAANPS